MRPKASVPRRSVIDYPGLRSEYAWLLPHNEPTITDPYQIGVSFTSHRGLVTQRGAILREEDIAPGDVFVTGRDRIVWTRVREHTEALQLFPSIDLIRTTAATWGQTSQFDIALTFRASDPLVLAVATLFKRAQVTGHTLSDVAASALAGKLVCRMLTRYAGVPLATGKSKDVVFGDPTLRRIADYVEASLDHTITLGDLANIAGVSPFHFSRVFRRTSGVSPYRYVTMRRMERAKHLFLTTQISVPAVAEALGFWNLSHFRRQFRAHTGFLPSDLRS
jgi:AraC family transcriptional regulator